MYVYIFGVRDLHLPTLYFTSGIQSQLVWKHRSGWISATKWLSSLWIFLPPQPAACPMIRDRDVEPKQPQIYLSPSNGIFQCVPVRAFPTVVSRIFVCMYVCISFSDDKHLLQVEIDFEKEKKNCQVQISENELGFKALQIQHGFFVIGKKILLRCVASRFLTLLNVYRLRYTNMISNALIKKWIYLDVLLALGFLTFLSDYRIRYRSWVVMPFYEKRFLFWICILFL